MLGNGWRIKDFEFAIALSDLNLQWDTATRAFYHVGEAWIAGIGSKELWIRVPVLFYLRKRRGGDDFTIFIDAPGGNWYFIRYRNNVCEIHSSDQSIKESIMNLKRKERKIKDKETRRIFILVPSSDQTALRFRDRFMQMFAPEEGN